MNQCEDKEFDPVYDTYEVAEYYLSYLIMGDDSGLEPSEIAALDNFINFIDNNAMADHPGHAWHFDIDTEDEGGFAQDYITGEFANCVELFVIVV